MNFIKKIFNKLSKSSLSKTGDPMACIPVTTQGDIDPVLKVDPSSITHAFIALARADMSHANELNEIVEYHLQIYYPFLWMWGGINAKYVIVTVNLIDDRFLNIYDVGPALTKHGLTFPYSIAYSLCTIKSKRSGETIKMLVGFAYHDIKPKLFFARKDGCSSSVL